MNALQYLRKTFWWIRVPFTYGHALEDGERLEGNDSDRRSTAVVAESAKFDGFISAIQGFLLIIAVTWTMTFTVHVSTHFNGSVSLVTLILLMITGLVVMCAMRRKVLASARATGTDDPSRDNLPIIGMTIFYVIVCLTDTCPIVALVACISTWELCKDTRIYGSYITKTIFHVVRIAFLGAETIFCIAFHRATFSNRPSTRYGLMFLQAVNFSLWFDALIHESTHLFDFGFARLGDIHPRCLSDVSNMSTVVLGCLYRNTTIYHYLDGFVNPKFLPFTIEFTLLAGERVFHWYYHCSVLADSHQLIVEVVDQTTSARETSAVENNGYNDQLQFGEDLPVGVERESGRSSNHASSDLLSFAEGVADNPTRTNYFLTFLAFFITIGLNVSLIFLSIRQKFTRDEGADIRYTKIYIYYRFVFQICKTVIIAAGYHSSAKFKVSRDRFTFLDYLIVFTALGPYVVNALSLIAIGELGMSANLTALTTSQTSPFSPAFHITFELLNAAEVFFQVGFCLYAARILVDLHDTRSYRTTVFKGTLLFLAVANGTRWIVGGIAGLGNVTMEYMVLEAYFEDVGRRYITNVAIFFPLSLFHRFICCLQFSKAYLRLS